MVVTCVDFLAFSFSVAESCLVKRAICLNVHGRVMSELYSTTGGIWGLLTQHSLQLSQLTLFSYHFVFADALSEHRDSGCHVFLLDLLWRFLSVDLSADDLLVPNSEKLFEDVLVSLEHADCATVSVTFDFSLQYVVVSA